MVNVLNKYKQFGSTSEAILYPLLLLVVLWLIFWADRLFPLVDFYKMGVMPGDVSSLKGILLMPLIHSNDGIEHILNNSLPTAILLGSIIYYYREIAFRVFTISWLMTGIGLWLFATNNNAYHIGISGVVYAMAGFLFASGVIRKYLPLQAISLFVAFVYGSMIWGIFPTEPHVSWEGHLSGLVVGVALAFIYRKRGPQAPKYLYEMEKELGIEPPDLEGRWNERVEQERRRLEELEKQKEILREASRLANKKLMDDQKGKKKPYVPPQVIYHYRPKQKPSDGNDQS